MGFEKVAAVIIGLALAAAVNAATLVIDEPLSAGEYTLTPVVAPPVDSDTDGFPDDVDACPDEYGTEPDGCPLPPVDTDGDGLSDNADACPTEPAQTPDGCPLPPDADNDGVPDSLDQCADTPAGDTVDSVGCTVTPTDPDDLAATTIGQIAATLAPGDSALLPGSPKIQGYREDGTSAPSTAEWTSSAYWYPTNATAWFLGLRISHRFISYRADADQWVEYPLGDDVPNSPDRFPGTGHTYESIALDQTRGHFYYLRGQYLYRYAIDSDVWEKQENPGLYGMVVEWDDSLDSLVVLGDSTLRAYKDGIVTTLGETPVDGYHSSMRYNRKRGDTLMIGGNYTLRTVALMRHDGTIEQRADAPFDFHINVCDLTYDPVSGDYLVITKDKALWEYNPDIDEWRQAAWNDGYPLHNYLQQVPIVIDDLGVIAWLLPGGMQIYRHKTVFDDAHPVTPTQDPDPPMVSDPDPGPTDNLLLEQAATMQPGEWRNISDLTNWDKVSKSVDYVDPADGSYPVTGMGWTQDLIYHDGSIMMLLMRGSDREVVFLHMDAAGKFTRTVLPYSGSRRPYNKLASDGEYFYWMTPARDFSIQGMLRTPLDNPGVFEPYSPNLLDSQIESMTSLTYVPEWGRFYAYTPGGKLWSWAHGESAWTLNDRLKEHLSGYAGLVLWNPVKKELIVAGGQTFGSNPELGHHLARITEPLGKLEILPDMLDPTGAPIPFRANASRMITDPRDGSYLINYEQHIYRNESAGGQYSDYLDLTTVGSPFGNYENYNPFALIPGTDVIVFLSHSDGVVLHRLM